MRIKTEEDILDIEVRKKIIEDIEGPENLDRKKKAFKDWMIYRDKTFRFVLEDLERQFDRSTVNEMRYSLTNISFFRKVIDKLSRVYANGARREIRNDAGEIDKDSTDKLSKLEDELDANTQMKVTNRYMKAFRNVEMYVKPCPFFDKEGNEKWRIRLSPMVPYLYDVVEEFWDRTRPMVYILSDFDQQVREFSTIDAAREGRGVNTSQQQRIGDGKDQIIADDKTDEGDPLEKDKKEYIWWSDKYHFTTNGKAEMIDEDGNDKFITEENKEEFENPIEEKPFINFALDRDNSFWAQGGEDLSMGAISLNSMMTNAKHVGITQGYGQFWMKGKNLPRNVAIGPTKSIIMEYEDGEPVPDIGFASASPNLNGLMDLVKMEAAMLLTTNNLSTSGVKAELTSGDFPSAVAHMLDKAESIEDVDDQRQIFIDNEPIIWKVVNKWIALYSAEGTLADNFQDLTLPDDFNFNIAFPPPKVFETEEEKLRNIKTRKDLGLNKMVELIRMDQPDLSEKEAQKKLLEIVKEKAERMAKLMINGVDNGEGGEDDFEQESDDERNRPVQ